MDERTLQVYEANAGEFADRYATVEGPLTRYFPLAFPPGSRVLEIGSGTGRDFAELVREGYEPYGVEPTRAFREIFDSQHPELHGRIRPGSIPDGLPDPTEIGGAVDGVVCSAVLQHVPRAQLFDAAFAIKSVLREGGRVLLSIPLNREVDAESRDKQGRLFNGVTPEELELLFERIGFLRIGRWGDDDSLCRPGHRWATLLFDLRAATESRPIDLIEAVLSRRERKVATYKLALLRGLCDVALTQPHRVRFGSDGMVRVPIAALVERWIVYYWPLFESQTFLPQMNGEWDAGVHKLAFAADLNQLIAMYSRAGGLTAFVLQARNGTLPTAAQQCQRALSKKLANTIRVGPVKYAGGALTERLFDHDAGRVLVASPLWRELSLTGHWIRDALVLRWADLVCGLARGDTQLRNAAIACLLQEPLPLREVSGAREVFAADSTCVWSDKRITAGKLAIDHVLPFSLWRNNDLWNLLPTHAKVNAEKSDKLPARDLLHDRRRSILECWERSRDRFPLRFDSEAAAQVGEAHPSLDRLFGVVAESVEVTALSRGCERWVPS